MNNLFSNIPDTLQEELFEVILNKPNIKIERIISDGHTTQTFEWYDQEDNEWVLLLQGEAVLSFENEDDLHLDVGEYVNISKHKKHRVSYTSLSEKTIWLAVHYK